MPAKLLLHPPHRASRFLVLRDGETLTVGRDPECSLVLEDSRVSKRHARLRWTGTGWVVEDLGSKNGTSVNGAPPSTAELAGGDWLSFGGLMGEFERVSLADVAVWDMERLARLHTSIEMKRRLGSELEPFDLLLRFLESALEVAGGERGFVLVSGPDGKLRTEIAAGFAPTEIEGDRLAGSVGAIERALMQRCSVVVSDAQRDPVLGRRASVVSMGIGALACVPLRHEGRLLGLLYLDSRRRATLDDLDVEILESLADHMSMVLASLQLDRKIRDLIRTTTAGADPSVIDVLHRRITTLAAGRIPDLATLPSTRAGA